MRFETFCSSRPFHTFSPGPSRAFLGRLSFAQWAVGLAAALFWCALLWWLATQGLGARLSALQRSGHLIGQLTRYARLYAYFVRFSFSRAMEFRMDFFFRIVMDCAFYGVNFAFFSVLFGHIEGLGGLSGHEVYIFVATYVLVDAINMTVFSNNLWMLPILINKGDLDYYLVRPVSSLFFVSLRDFAANSFVNLVLAMGILAIALLSYPEPFSAFEIGRHLVFIGISSTLYWGLYSLFVLPTFWTHSADGLRQVWFSLRRFQERPHRIYQGWLRRIFMSLFPIALIASYPTYLLLEGGPTWPMWVVPAVLFGVVQIVWQAGLRAYSSASS